MRPPQPRQPAHRADAAAPPFAVWRAAANRIAVLAVTRAAEAAGLRPGQSLADAQALYPKLHSAEADPAADRRALDALAAWCRRFSPWTAPLPADDPGLPPGEAGLWLEVTGCAHLLGGEAALVRTVTAALSRAGYSTRGGLAGTPGAAYALARFAPDAETPTGAIAEPGSDQGALAPLPVAALRLDSGIIQALDALGLRRIGDLTALRRGPRRATLARRFPALLLERLDAALGHRFEPIGPGRDRPRFATRLGLPEPSRAEAVTARICDRLIEDLAALLARHGHGARRFVFSAYETSGGRRQATVETARPLAQPDPLRRLFALKLGAIDPGQGLDGFTLEAFATAPLAARQRRLVRDDDPAQTPREERAADSTAALAPLIDRLHGRFGRKRVRRIALTPNHLPERAQTMTEAITGAIAQPVNPDPAAAVIPGPRPLSRPVRLLERPEAVDAVAEVPDGPPVRLRWHGTQHRVVGAAGPERIALDWWTLPGWQADPAAPAQPPALGAAIRDYYRVETESGLRLWVYRSGLHRADAPAGWYLHGVFP